LDSTKQMSAASDVDKRALCDWFAPMVGGYGAASTCGSALFVALPDRATCVSAFPACDVSVGVFQDCVQRMVSAQNACTEAAETAAAASTSCRAVGAARCFD
jgi:hypothetical protein